MMDGFDSTILERGALVGSGTEGEVFHVLGQPGLLLKVFKEEPDPAARARITTLIARHSRALDRVAAWPREWVRSRGQCALVLPFAKDTHAIHNLFDRDGWHPVMPGIDWSFMVKAATSLAEAVATVHAAGMAVVDISEQNARVDSSGRVTLIDCDSFVVTGQGAQSCSPLSTPGWLAPELAGAVAVTPRTANHDNFALARMIFQLLFAGRAPLEPPPGKTSEQPERVFGYSRIAPVRPPDPRDIALDDVTEGVAGYFEAAFARRGRVSPPRPTAAEWTSALKKMGGRLRGCGIVSSHRHLAGKPCPWCRMASYPDGRDPFRQPPPLVQPQPQPKLARPAVTGKATQKPKGRAAKVAKYAASIIAIGVAIGQFTKHYPAPSAGTTQSAENRAITFASEFWRAFNDANPRPVWDRSYAATVKLDREMTRDEAVNQKMAQVRKWTHRIYSPRTQDATARCNWSGTFCTVGMKIDYRVSNASSSVNDTWKTTMELNMTGAIPLVTSEQGCRVSVCK